MTTRTRKQGTRASAFARSRKGFFEVQTRARTRAGGENSDSRSSQLGHELSTKPWHSMAIGRRGVGDHG